MPRGGRSERDLRDERSGPKSRAIARDLGLARNTVLRYLNSPEAMVPKPRPPRGSKLDPYTEYIDRHRQAAAGTSDRAVDPDRLAHRHLPSTGTGR